MKKEYPGLYGNSINSLSRIEIEKELELIITEPYKTEQSERNHQIFAKALLYLIQKTPW